MQHWLLVRGRGDRPLERIHRDEVRAHSSSKRPSVQPGDLAVLYASVWQAVYGIAEVVGAPENDPSRTRSSWRFALRSLAVLADLDRAPAVEEIGVFPASLWRHSYIRLTPEQFARASALLAPTVPGTVARFAAAALRLEQRCQAPSQVSNDAFTPLAPAIGARHDRHCRGGMPRSVPGTGVARQWPHAVVKGRAWDARDHIRDAR